MMIYDGGDGTDDLNHSAVLVVRMMIVVRRMIVVEFKNTMMLAIGEAMKTI